jgi:hypothetical protein
MREVAVAQTLSVYSAIDGSTIVVAPMRDEHGNRDARENLAGAELA